MLFTLVKRYSDALGPVGHERPVMDLLRQDWARAEIQLTPVGNLLAHVQGPGRRLLIQTHADEIGLMVKSITPSGFLRVTQGAFGSELQAPPSPWLQMQRVKVMARGGWVDGLIGLATGHIRTSAQTEKTLLEWGDIFVDVGAQAQQDVERIGIEVGAPIVFASELFPMGRYIAGKALDARAGLAIMTAFLQRLDPKALRYDLYLGATVQEEMGLIGAPSLADVGFDLAVGIEVGLAGDIPTVDQDHMPTRLGAGPVILVKDRQLHYDISLTERLKQVARDCGIPFQLAVFQGFSSDLREFAAQGVPSALVTFATRYTHSPWEIGSLEDMEQIVDLLLAFVRV